MDTFHRGIKWLVWRSSNLKFLFDNWTNHNPMHHMIQGPFSMEASELRIEDIFQEARWNWDRLSFDLPWNIKLLLPWPLKEVID